MNRIPFKKVGMAALCGATMLGTVAHAAVGIQIDPKGAKNLSAAIVEELSFSTGNVLFDECFGTLGETAVEATSCTMYGQSSIRSTNLAAFGFAGAGFPNAILTFGFSIPIDVWLPTAGDFANQVQVQNRAGQKGTFKLYLDLNGLDNGSATLEDGTFSSSTIGPADKSGEGFSNLGNDTVQAGVIELLAGDMALVDEGNPTGLFGLPITGNSNSVEFDELVESNRPVRGTTSSYSAVVDVKTQNKNYVVNDLVNTGFSLEGVAADITNLLASINLPSAEGWLVGRVVTNDVDYGSVGSGLAGNDWDCESSSQAGSCDYQVLSKGSFKFRGQQVSEPTTLAILGLGVGAMGLVQRRRKAKSIV